MRHKLCNILVWFYTNHKIEAYQDHIIYTEKNNRQVSSIVHIPTYHIVALVWINEANCVL